MEERDFTPEFSFVTSRSSGAGGQHVNKVETKVSLLFNISESILLTEEEKSIIFEKLSGRINKEGILKVTSQKERSQLKNKLLCISKFYTLIENALTPQKERKATKLPRSVKEKRLSDKKRNSEKKSNRKKPDLE